MASNSSTSQPFNIDEAKAALSDILESFKQPENVTKMSEAKENAGNDMLKMMQLVFPLATQIQMSVIPKYGFPNDGDGVIRFAQTIKLLEKQDTEVADLNAEVRSIIMPHMAVPDPQLVAT